LFGTLGESANMGAVTVHFLPCGEFGWQNLQMEPGSEPIKLVKAHLGDGYAKLASLVSPYFAGHDFPAWEAVKAKADYVVGCAEICWIVV
jgi:hypothetical protein